MRSCARAATWSRWRLSASQRASSDSLSEERIPSIAESTSLTSRTPPGSTEKSRSWRETRSAASVRGAILREMDRPARRATRATAARLPSAPAASMMFWGLGSESLRDGDANWGM